MECLQDAEMRIKDTKILIASIIGGFVIFVSILICSSVCECCKCCKCHGEGCCDCFKNRQERASIGNRSHQKGAHSNSHLSVGTRSSGASTGSAGNSGSPTAVTDNEAGLPAKKHDDFSELKVMDSKVPVYSGYVYDTNSLS